MDKLTMMRHLKCFVANNILGDVCLRCLALVESLSLQQYNPLALAKFVTSQRSVSDEEVLLLKLPEHILVYRDDELYLAMCVSIDGQNIFCFESEHISQLSSGDYIRPREEVTCIIVKYLDSLH